MKKVSTKVQDIITRFKTQELEIVRGYRFNQYNNIIRINLYLNQRFLECKDPRAVFWDLSTPRITHTAKNIDLDTKDLMPYAIGKTNMFQVWIARVLLRKWLRDKNLAVLLDDLVDGVASFGSAVWKICKTDKGKTIEEVDLRNLYFDQTAKYIKDVPVVEMHYKSPMEVKRKEDVWDNVDKLLKNPPVNQKNEYDIWEYWGELENEDGTLLNKHTIGYNFGDAEIILFDEEFKEKDFPYRDFHIGKYRGRWQRIGIVERLFKLQEQANTIVNHNAKANEIASLLLLRSTDVGTGANVLEQARNGQIINSVDLQQIGIDNRAFSTLLTQLQSIEAQADRLCLTPEIVVGENLPSGTPFRSLATLSNAAKSAFKSSRDRIAAGLEDILRTEILPDVIKKWQKKDIVQIAESADDIKFYEDSLIAQRRLETIAKGNREGRVITPEELKESELNALNEIKEVGRVVEIPENYFNFDFGLRFMITSESYDKQQQNDAMSNAISMMMQNPAIVNTPVFKQYVENNGIEWWRLTPEQTEQMAQTAQAMGGKPMPEQPKQDKLMSMVNAQ